MNFRTQPYTSGIMIGTGRPQTKDAPAFGKRLATTRIAKGWSQTELAERLNTTLKMIDYYERRAHNPSVEFVRQAARVLGVSVAELLGEEVQVKRSRKTGPTGKVHKVFEEVSKLPRGQQEKIVEVVSALVSQYAQGKQ
ncbi:MAG TPA: helix-turn-helix transcriptional regulator [Pyrinomonadaceae bacterium]